MPKKKKRGFIEETREYASNFFSNLDQPDMSFGEKWSKFMRNRYKATIKAQGCCGHPGEPGC